MTDTKYCSLEALKARLGLISTNEAEDESLESAREIASRMIDDYCETQFYPVTQTRFFTPFTRESVVIDDVISVTSLLTDLDGDRIYEYTWQATDYDLYPFTAQQQSQPKPYWRLDVTPFGNYWFPVGVTKSVQVVGSWGFSTTVPAAVESACLYQAQLIHRMYGAPGGEYGGGQFGQQVNGLGLHPFARQQLAPFKRMGIG